MSRKLTKQVIDDLTPPSSGNRIHFDDAVPGFGIRITAAGDRTFVFNYRVSGRQRRWTIGPYGVWSVTAARNEAKRLYQEVKGGADPQGNKHADRAAAIVADLANKYEAKHLPRKRPSSQHDDKAMLRLYVRPRLGKLKVADVSYDDIDTLHRALKAKPYRANRVLSLLSKMFSLAIRWQMRTDNPCKGIERFPEVKREVYFTGHQRAALLVAMQEHAKAGTLESRTVRAFRLAMLTGARIGEVLGATWSQFDIETGKWTKPGSTTKQRTTHHAALNAPARQLLSEMMQGSKGEFLFPCPSNPKQPQADYKKSWQRIRHLATVELWRQSDKPEVADLIADLEKGLHRTPTHAEATVAARKLAIELPAGLLDFRVHDLRHSFASEGAAAGLSLPMIGALLGHTNPATTARYAHLLDDPLKAAAEKIGSRMVGGSEREAS